MQINSCYVVLVISTMSQVHGNNDSYDTIDLIRTFDPAQNYDLLDALSLLRADNFFRIKSSGFQVLRNHSCGIQLLEYMDALSLKDPWAVKSKNSLFIMTHVLISKSLNQY